MKPLLAHVYEPHRISFPCYVQPKLNGVRALYQNGHFQSRDQLPWSDGILAHLATELLGVFPPSTVLDGELYVHGWPLQRINGAVTPVRKEQRADTPLVEYHVFDRVDFSSSFEQRWSSLPHGVQFGQIHFVETCRADNFIAADALYAKWVGEGYEGMMYRLGRCPYTTPKQRTYTFQTTSATHHWPPPGKLRYWSDQENRTWHLLKRKSWMDDEFECIGVQEGEGKYRGMVGALVCRAKPPAVAPYVTFTVGSGLSDSDRAFYMTNPPIGRKIKVKFLCLSSDGIPLNPTILAVL